jgi:hypothetical protein
MAEKLWNNRVKGVCLHSCARPAPTVISLQSMALASPILIQVYTSLLEFTAKSGLVDRHTLFHCCHAA